MSYNQRQALVTQNAALRNSMTNAGNSSFSGIAGRNLYTTATSNPSNSWNNVGFSAGRLY